MKQQTGKPSGKGEALRIVLAITFGLMFFWYALAYTGSTEDEYGVTQYNITGNLGLLLAYILLTLNTVAVFVLSIIHLNMYKEKGLAVTSLVFASLFILICIGMAV